MYKSVSCLISARLNGAATQKIRTHHEILARENEKLARQLYQRDRQQQGPPPGKRVIVVEEERPVQRVNSFIVILNKAIIYHFSLLAKSTTKPSCSSNLCQ